MRIDDVLAWTASRPKRQILYLLFEWLPSLRLIEQARHEKAEETRATPPAPRKFRVPTLPKGGRTGLGGG